MISAVCAALLFGNYSFASSPNIWRQDQIFNVSKSPYIDGRVEKGGCNYVNIITEMRSGVFGYFNACVMDGKGISIARYIETRPWPLPSIDKFSIKKDQDTFYHDLEGVSPAHILFNLLPDSGYLIAHNISYDANSEYPDYDLYRNPLDAFTYSDSEFIYTYSKNNKVSLFSRNDPDNVNNYANVVSATFSANGRYMLAYLDHKLFDVIDLLSGEDKVISKIQSLPIGYSIPSAGAISNDGRYAYIANLNFVYDTRAGCGAPLSIQMMYNNPDALTKECPFTSLNVVLSEAINYEYGGVLYEFAENDSVLKFVTYYIYSANGSRENITVSTEAARNQVKTLNYLALGDSYSSGEGDVPKSGNSYYSSETDYIGGCHLSERSYPFLVAKNLGVEKEGMRSVACSGARMMQDIARLSVNYYGQGERLAGLTEAQIHEAQVKALNNFTPGIAGQLDFVAKYKPGIITVTGGGNDVGFGNVLINCAGLDLSFEGIVSNSTCTYALPESLANKSLAKQIESQYDTTVFFINQVKRISPKTKIYIVGYPQFVAWHIPGVCRIDAGLLNVLEIKMMNSNVTRMNNVLRKASLDNGVNFIDVENSLAGGRLCEGGVYFTSLNDVPGYVFGSSMGDKNQAFHPNAIGHQKIADAIAAYIKSH